MDRITDTSKNITLATASLRPIITKFNLPAMSSSLTVSLVSWSAAVPSSVSTRCSSSLTELFPSSPPFSSRVVILKSNSTVVS